MNLEDACRFLLCTLRGCSVENTVLTPDNTLSEFSPDHLASGRVWVSLISAVVFGIKLVSAPMAICRDPSPDSPRSSSFAATE